MSFRLILAMRRLFVVKVATVFFLPEKVFCVGGGQSKDTMKTD